MNTMLHCYYASLKHLLKIILMLSALGLLLSSTSCNKDKDPVAASWQEVPVPQVSSRNSQITTITAEGNDIFIISFDDILKSSDNGNSWKSLYLNYSGSLSHPIATEGQVIYTTGIVRGLIKSMDGGITWKPISSDLIFWGGGADQLALSGNKVIVSESGGCTTKAFISEGGQNWSVFSEGLPATTPTGTCFGIYDLLIQGPKVYAASNNGVYQTDISAGKWVAANTGFDNPGPDLYVSCLVGNEKGIYAGTHAGVYFSADQAQNWQPKRQGLPDSPVWSLALSGTKIIAATGENGVYLSTDNATTWKAINEGLPLNNSPLSPSVASVAANSNFGFALIDGKLYRRKM